MSGWNAPPPTYDATHLHDAGSLPPYLQLPHLLSLTWLAYPILSLIFIAFRLQLSLGDAQNAVAGAKDDLLTACKAAEEAATSAASLPRYLALQSNEQFASAVNGSMRAARGALILSLTAMEGIINFVIDIYRSTLLCFLELIVRSGLAVLVGAVQGVNDVLETVTNGLRSSIQNDISSANSAIQSAVDAFNRINPFDDLQAPSIPVPNLDGLQDIQIPASVQDSLTQLNASIPSVADIKGKLEDLISTPFELLKQDINETFAGLTFSPSGLPVPEQNRLTFCDKMDTSVVDEIGQDLIKTARIGVVILILVALLLIGLNCLLTWYKWRCMRNHLEYTRQAWNTDPTIVHTKIAAGGPPTVTLSDHNLMILNANSEHPLVTRIMNQISRRFRLSPSKHSKLQWFFNYIFHPPAMACFLIGFFGLLCVELQLLALGPLAAKFRDRANDAASDFSSTIAASINESMYNQSATYAREVNAQVDAVQTSLNEGLFGWVNGTTTSINATLNEFYADVEGAVNTVFGNSILATPANEFVRCFLGSKIDAIENAITFLHDNLKVDMPRVNDTVLVLSQSSVDEATAPIAAAALGGGEGSSDQGVLGRIIESYAASLKKERVMFGIFMALWGVVILMGICVLLWHSYAKDYIERRKARKWQKENGSGFDPQAFWPDPTGKAVEDSAAAPPQRQLNSFSPLPSPRGSVFRPFWASRTSLNVLSNRAPIADAENPNTSDAKESRGSSEALMPTSVDNAPAAPGLQKKATMSNKFFALGKKAFGKEQEGEAQKSAEISEISDPMGPNKRDTAWFGRWAARLSRRNPQDDFEDTWGVREKEETLIVRPEEDRQLGSRWSTSPAAHQTSWKNIIPSRKPTVTITPPSDTSSSRNLAPPLIGAPIRPRRGSDLVNLDTEEDPFSPSHPAASYAPPPPTHVFPIPLHNGFDSRHEALQNPFAGGIPARHQPRSFSVDVSSPTTSTSPPPPPISPKLYQPSTGLAPPPRDNHRHRRSVSTGGVGGGVHWRVTNATPSDTLSVSDAASTMTATTNTDVYGGTSPNGTTPVTRYLTTNPARKSSIVNPFITPFDDEHRVRIVKQSSEEQLIRKSYQTNPTFATGTAM